MPRRGDAPHPVAARFGDAVHQVRTARNETLDDVAGRIPSTATRAAKHQKPTMDPKYLSELEKGWHAPSIITAKAIADALHVSFAELVAGL